MPSCSSLYVRFAVERPCLLLVGTLLVVLPTAFFGVLNFTLSDPEGGQTIRDSLEAQQAHAFARAIDLAKDSLSSEAHEPQQTEKLEQLRALENGAGITVIISDIPTVAVDVPADLERAEAFLRAQNAT